MNYMILVQFNIIFLKIGKFIYFFTIKGVCLYSIIFDNKIEASFVVFFFHCDI